MHHSIRILLALALAIPATAAELARGAVYSVVELSFVGPPQKPSDAPARESS